MGLNKKIVLLGASAILSFSAVSHAEVSVGHAVGTYGFGAYVSGDTGWHFTGKDQIQWRAVIGGGELEVDKVEIDDVKYEGDVDLFGTQVGLDWFPFESNQFFVSGGAAYFDREYELNSRANKNFTVGNQFVSASDGVRLDTDIDHSSFAPYVSVGWGNKHKGRRGLSYFAEVGVLFPLDDADVNTRVSGNTSVVSAADIRKHERDVEDDINGPQLNATIGIGYRF